MHNLSRAQQEELLRLLEERERRRSRRKLFEMYPETGPLRRELYSKHMEFFRAGSKHRERCFMAANRCVTPDTVIDTEYGPAPASDAFFGRSGRVVSWDGRQEVLRAPQGGHEVGEGLTFRVGLDNGSSFICSDRHQVLSWNGWRHPERGVELVGGRVVENVVREGRTRLVDVHVPGTNNYKAAGVYHHNCGKTEGAGGYETVLHLTGHYPDWWEGRKFDHPIRAWAAGDTSQTVRDILQYKLLGPPGDFGTGLIPGDDLVKTTMKAGMPNAVQDVTVRHATGGKSFLTLKSFDQRRESFQGTEQHVIWLDEEVGLDIYSECLMRTMTTDGLVMLTFTPLQGLTEVVQTFLPGGQMPEQEPV